MKKCPRSSTLFIALIAALALAPPAAIAKPRVHETKADRDGDGVPNTRDRDIDGDGKANGNDRDTDGDGKANSRDREIDSDGRKNARDRDIDADRILNARDQDVDADGQENRRDRDIDSDGRPNSKDRDMDGDGEPNGYERDTDGDRIPDDVDPDIDGDGIANYIDDDSDGTGDDVTRLPHEVNVRVPRDFFGLVADEIFWGGQLERVHATTRVLSTGAGTIRQLFDWSLVEQSPGKYQWEHYDHYVADATKAGFSILPILYHPPEFHSGRPAGDTTHGTFPPRSNDSLAAFGVAAVKRYGPSGSFWAEHPLLPKRPLRAWQVWNEPNLRVYWLPRPNAAAYTEMLRTVGGAIRGADPGAEIVSGGMPQSKAGMDMDQYVKGMYAAGARGTFDTFAIHPYAGAADGVYSIVHRFRKLLDKHGDTDARIWITELGWATGGPNHPFHIGEAAQAELIRRVMATLVAQSQALKLRGLVYFNWRDLPLDPNTGDRWGLHTGLFRYDGGEKPGFTAFRDAVAALAR